MLHMCVCYILASSRITRSGSWMTDPSFLRWFCHRDHQSYSVCGTQEIPYAPVYNESLFIQTQSMQAGATTLEL
jgi:hypothetical protein